MARRTKQPDIPPPIPLAPKIPRWGKTDSTGRGYRVSGCRHLSLYVGPHIHIAPEDLRLAISVSVQTEFASQTNTSPRQVALFYARKILEEALLDVEDLEKALRDEKGEG